MKTLLKIYLLSLCLSNAFAVETIQVQALMPGMVVLKVDGERVTLKTGQQSAQGVKMISSDSRSAVLEVNGEQKQYQMGTAVSTNFSQRDIIFEQIMINNNGMFMSHGSINGHSVKYLVDTGASSVAMSSRDARKLGIQYRLNGEKIRASTASGIADGWVVNLKSVRLGKLIEYNVKGVVVDGDHPREVLLGMTFLNRMKVEKEAGKMTITQKQ